MKRILCCILAAVCLCLAGCGAEAPAPIAATTAPVWQFATAICEGTDLTVSRLVTENVSCLHDYTLTVGQMQRIEESEVIILSGAGLEEFMSDVLPGRKTIDASQGIALLEMSSGHSHSEEEDHAGHSHEHDPHIWLSPANARIMAGNICDGLSALYPRYEATFRANLEELNEKLYDLEEYGKKTLADLSCRQVITFHDGFGYLAQAFDLEILRAIEEESGSEASAKELIELIEEVEHHALPAVFTEVSGSASAAEVLCGETGIPSYPLDMAMAGDDYFAAMYHNIDTLKEALQ